MYNQVCTICKTVWGTVSIVGNSRSIVENSQSILRNRKCQEHVNQSIRLVNTITFDRSLKQKPNHTPVFMNHADRMTKNIDSPDLGLHSSPVPATIDLQTRTQLPIMQGDFISRIKVTGWSNTAAEELCLCSRIWTNGCGWGGGDLLRF